MSAIFNSNRVRKICFLSKIPVNCFRIEMFDLKTNACSKNEIHCFSNQTDLTTIYLYFISVITERAI